MWEVNTYMISYHSGESQEIQADFYETNGTEWLVFYSAQVEVLRLAAADVASITKAR
jgi:hypothetical protein